MTKHFFFQQSPPIISPANLPSAAMLPTAAVGFAPQSTQPAAFAAAMAALSGQLSAEHAAGIGGGLSAAAHLEQQTHLQFPFTTATSEAQMLGFAAQHQMAAAVAAQAQAQASAFQVRKFYNKISVNSQIEASGLILFNYPLGGGVLISEGASI